MVSIKVLANVYCMSKNVVYVITCEKCYAQYIKKTEIALDERIREHIGYVNNVQLQQPSGLHFNQPGHHLHHLKASVLENIFAKRRKLI